MQKYTNSVQTLTGDAVQGATITVTTNLGAPVTVYSDNSGTVLASVTTDVKGMFYFYAVDGRYNLSISGPGIYPYTINDIIIDDTLNSGLIDTVVSTVANLKALSKTVYGSAITNGYWSAGDGGGGSYWYDSVDTTSADNGGSIIVATDGGRWKLNSVNGVLNVKQWGAKGDGSNNDEPYLASALTYLSSIGGGVLSFPKSNYKLNFSTTTLLTVPANVTLLGENKPIFTIDDNAVAGSKIAFNFSGDNACLENIEIVFAVDEGVAFKIAADNIKLKNLSCDGGHTAILTTTFHGVSLNDNGTYQQLNISDGIFHNFRYFLLKSNTSTGTITNIVVKNNLFYDNYANHFALNSPLGSIENVSVINNTFLDCPGGDAFSTYAIMLGMASAKDVRIVGNHFEGICKEAIHIEEAADNVIISGNTFKALTKGANTNGGRGVYIQDNNISGSSISPDNIVITNNVFDGDTTANADVGIYVVRSAILPVDNINIANNEFKNFATGIEFTDISNHTQINNNNIHSCTTGINVNESGTSLHLSSQIQCNLIHNSTSGIVVNAGWENIKNNTILDTTTGLVSDRPGMFGFTTFYNVTDCMTSGGGPSEIMGFAYSATGLTIAATPSTTVLDFINFPDVCYGQLSVALSNESSSTQRVIRHYDLAIDSGGAVTSTLKAQRSVGNIATSGAPLNNAGKLALTFTNSSAVSSNNIINVSFNGTYSIT